MRTNATGLSVNVCSFIIWQGILRDIQNLFSFCDKFLALLLTSHYFYLILLPAYGSSTQPVYITFVICNLNLHFPYFHNYRLTKNISLPNLT